MRTFEQYIRESVDFRLGGSANKGDAAELIPDLREYNEAVLKSIDKWDERSIEMLYSMYDSNFLTPNICFDIDNDLGADFTSMKSTYKNRKITDKNMMFFTAETNCNNKDYAVQAVVLTKTMIPIYISYGEISK